MNKQSNLQIIPAAILIFCAALTRFFPHPPNFTAIGAMAIFGGSVLSNKKLAFLLPLAALFLSDLALGVFSGTKGFYGGGQFFVYGAFLLITALSTLIKKKTPGNLIFAAVWSGVIFFILSNFGTWISGQVAEYPLTYSGLMKCYAKAIPFYQNEFFGNFALNAIYGNLFFGAILFAVYRLVENNLSTSKSIA